MDQKTQHLSRTEPPSGKRPRSRQRKTKRGLTKGARVVILVILVVLVFPRVKSVFGDHSTNILLLGVDQRSGDVGRSDTMMLLNYNAVWNTLHLISVPRDTRVKLSGYGNQKINAAYVYGGPDLAKKAVSNLTGLCVDYFVKVDFDGFAKVVDALGGVTIDIKEKMNYDDPYQDLHIHFKPGRQRLTGNKALEYVRWRGGVDADLGRVQRQRQFLDAALRRAVSPAGVLRAPLVLAALPGCLETDIPLLERPGLAVTVAIARIKGMASVTVPGDTATIGNGSYFIADEDKLQEIISSWKQPPWSNAKKSADKAP